MIEAYQSQFAMSSAEFTQEDQISMIHIKNQFAQAKITPHGGSVLSYQPVGQEDVLWVSPTAVFNGQKPVRGGIPICWPWFGAHPSDASLPAHGFVRNALWQLDSIEDLASGETQVVLSFHSNEATLKLWPHAFHLELCILVGQKLVMNLTTKNLEEAPLQITEALHTYFNIGQASQLPILGFDQTTHLDKLNDAPAEIQQGDIVLNPPMDSVYLNHQTKAIIQDTENQRQIWVEKQSSKSCVVWNPGPEIVKGFADIPDADWSNFVCVEAGNVLDNSVEIAAGQAHTLTMMLSSQPL